MGIRRGSSRRWILVHVWRGIPVEVEAYRDRDAAIDREFALRQSIDREDEVALFEVNLHDDPALATA